MSTTSRFCGRRRHRVRDAEIDEARFLAARDHLDREAERGARLAQELRRILRHAQRVGARPRAPRCAASPRSRSPMRCERLQRARLRGAVDALFGGQAGAQAHHLAQRVERVDLPVDDAPDLQVEAVRAEVDRGEQVGAGHAHGAA